MTRMKNIYFLCSLMSVVKACTKSYFYDLPDYANTDNVILEFTGATKKACLRTCRMHIECYAFNMIWDGNVGLGTCQILSWKDNLHAAQLQYQSGSTYYHTCPGRMVWNPDNAHCYEMIEETKSFDDAVVHCANLYPGSHLVDLTSEQEDQFVTNMSMPLIAKKPFHVGGKRENSASDFNWNNTGEVLVYTGWLATYPKVHDKNCIFISIVAGDWGWGNWACDALKYFICEF